MTSVRLAQLDCSTESSEELVVTFNHKPLFFDNVWSQFSEFASHINATGSSGED